MAAVWLKKCRIVLLDEFNSAQDQVSERNINEALQRHFDPRNGHTYVAVVHRLANVLAYDRVIVLGGGKIIETGEPSQLLGDGKSELSSMVSDLPASRREALLKHAAEIRSSRAEHVGHAI